MLMRRCPPLAAPLRIMVVVSFLMLVPFYWVLKTSLTGENIYAYPPRIVPVDPHLFNYVDVWYMIPFARYLLNSVIVSAMAIAGNLLFNAAAGYALTQAFPGRRWVVHALPVVHADPLPGDHHPGLPDHRVAGRARHLSRPRAAAALDHHLHLRLQGELRGGAALADRRGADRRAWRMAHHRAHHAAAVEVGDRHQRHPHLHLVVEHLPVAADRDPHARHADPAARAGALPVLMEDTTGALYAFVRHGAGARASRSS